jgi:serine/threonine protein kinase
VADEGRLIDSKYRLDAVLRTSPDAVVYTAQHTRIHRTVEVKTLAPSHPIEGHEAARLVREGRAAGRVAHRNVQSVVDSGVDETGRPFVVYEAIDGRTLGSLIAEGPIPLERAATLVHQLLEAIQTVHDAGMLHRSIGPESVIVAPFPGGELVKLTRFDDAVLLSEGNEAEPLVHAPPPAYVAPELRDGGKHTFASDVFGAGALLRALVTGSPVGATTDLPEMARRVVEQATAERVEERFVEADRFLYALSVVLDPDRARDLDTSDPLAADLHFLKLRRPTKITAVEPPRVEGRMKLLAVLLLIEAIYKELGDRWPALVERVPEVESLLPGAGNTETNRERGVLTAVVANVLSVADEIGGRGDLRFVAMLGERVGRQKIRKLLPTLAGPFRPDQLIQSFASLWSAVTRDGTVEILDAVPGAARFSVRDQPEPFLEITAFVAGLLRGALIEAGAKNPRVQTPTCEALGDAATVFRVRWDPW